MQHGEKLRLQGRPGVHAGGAREAAGRVLMRAGRRAERHTLSVFGTGRPSGWRRIPTSGLYCESPLVKTKWRLFRLRNRRSTQSGSATSHDGAAHSMHSALPHAFAAAFDVE
jgi:hypothetical protein